MFDDEPDDDLFLDDENPDYSESTEPVVYLLTIYPDPDESTGAIDDGWVENALLVLPEVKNVSLKRVSQ